MLYYIRSIGFTKPMKESKSVRELQQKKEVLGPLFFVSKNKRKDTLILLSVS